MATTEAATTVVATVVVMAEEVTVVAEEETEAGTHMSKIKRLIPLLVCEDIPAAHDFLVHAFGFTSGGIHRTPEGQAVHAEVRAGELVIWLHRVAAEQKLASPRSMPAASSGLVVFVEDVDAHYARARENGARPESEPKDTPYGQREYGVSDSEGHRWYFAAPLREHS